jgi:hypothetical protein
MSNAQTCPRCPDHAPLRKIADFQQPYHWVQCEACAEIYLRPVTGSRRRTGLSRASVGSNPFVWASPQTRAPIALHPLA